MRRIGPRPMTTTERVARHRDAQAQKIQQLRRALLDALATFNVGDRDSAAFYLTYADVIARAYEAEKGKRL